MSIGVEFTESKVAVAEAWGQFEAQRKRNVCQQKQIPEDR
jgi:hypothetical protein